jgi:hypothetical protein
MIMTYWKAKLIIKNKLHKTELFESVEKARLWSMKESKLAVSHRRFNDTNIITEITSHEFA